MKRKAKFHVGQIVVLRLSTEKLPTRIINKELRTGYWYYEIGYHSGHYLESVLRALTKRERGAVAGK